MREPCAVKVARTVLRGEGFRQRVLPTRPRAATSVMTEPVEPSGGRAYRAMVVLVTVRWTVAVLSGGIPRGVARCSCLT